MYQTKVKTPKSEIPANRDIREPEIKILAADILLKRVVSILSR